MVRAEDVKSIALAVAIPLVGGQLASLPGFKSIAGWYQRLRKPKWNPPDWLFGAAWPILYTAQGVASWIVWNENKGTTKGRLPLTLYGLQLLLNLAWQPIMFKLHRTDLALADASAMLGMAAAASVAMTNSVPGNKNKAAVAGLMSPYVAWIAFATALNARIHKDNPNADKIEDSPPAGAVAQKVGGAVSNVSKAASKAT